MGKCFSRFGSGDGVEALEEPRESELFHAVTQLIVLRVQIKFSSAKLKVVGLSTEFGATGTCKSKQGKDVQILL